MSRQLLQRPAAEELGADPLVGALGGDRLGATLTELEPVPLAIG